MTLFPITDRALAESLRPKIEPQLVLEIEGIATLFGAVTISRLIRIGDPGLLIGSTWRIGGVVPVDDQKQNINFDSGTTTRIEQQLYPDKGSVSSISSAQVALNDEGLIMSRIISPGIVVDDVLGRKAKIWMGFKNTAFKEDYTVIFSGVIDDIDSGSGVVKLNIAAPDTLKRQQLFTPITVTLDGTIEDTDTTVPLEDASKIPLPGIGPDGSTETALKYYIRVNDEIIQYTGRSGNDLTGCIRGSLATLPARHQVNMVWTCLTQFTTDFYLAIPSPSCYFSFWAPNNAQKYYIWFSATILSVLFANDPGLPDAIGIQVDVTGVTSDADIAARIKTEMDAHTSGQFTVVRNGPSLRVTCTDAGKAPKPDAATSGFAIDVLDEGLDGIDAATLVQLEDTPTNCALKLLLSGLNDFYIKDLAASRYLHPDPLSTVANSVFFEGVDLNRDYGVVPGDFVTIASAINGANNCAAKVIEDVVVTPNGSYMIVEDVTFVAESDTTALVSIRSKYDTLGVGMGLTPDQVDVLEHEYWRDYILGSYFYRFVIQDTIVGRDFLDKEVYLPVGAFSLPRQGRCSMGYTTGPIAREDIKVLNRDNIKDPDTIRLRRTVNRNFNNAVIYQFDQQASDTSAYGTTLVTENEDSQTRIPVGTKAFVVTSAGLRASLSGLSIAETVSNRWLARYRFAAEYFEAIGLLFRDGYSIEPGDIVLFDPSGLQISETADGTRNKKPKLFSVVNKSLDLKTGDVKVTLIDTNFDASQRFGVVAPSSLITGGTTTSLKIKDSFNILYPGNESKKWKDFAGAQVLVHSADWTREELVTLSGIDPTDQYNLLLDPTTPLGSVPTDGLILDVPNYDDADVKSQVLYAFISPTVDVVSGSDSTHFDVDSGDVSKFVVGASLRIHNASFTLDSGDNTVKSISGTTIETTNDIGFTPTSACVAELLPFSDGKPSYRVF